MKTIATLTVLLFLMETSFAGDQGQPVEEIENLKQVSGAVAPLHFTKESAPWAVKYYFPGFVREEDVRSEACQLFDHKIVIRRRYGKLRTEQVIHLDTHGPFAVLSKQAFEEEIVEGGPAPCDIPYTVVMVNRWLPEVGPEPFTIYNSGGCGNTPRSRTGPASRIFMDMLGQYCPNTVEILSID